MDTHMKKTQSQKINEQNAKAVKKLKQGVQETAKLQEKVRNGELTAGQAFLLKGEKTGNKKFTDEQLEIIKATLAFSNMHLADFKRYLNYQGHPDIANASTTEVLDKLRQAFER